MFSIVPLINYCVTTRISFFTRHSNNHNIKYSQQFWFIWIVFINVFINIVHIIRVLNKSFRTITMIRIYTSASFN